VSGSWQHPVSLLVSFLLALLLALYLTPIFRDAARNFGIVDAPDGGLKTQREPIPYLGGVVVFSSVLFPVALFLHFSDKVAGLLLAASIVVLLGLIDDIGRLSPRIKLLVQVIAVFLMMKAGIRVRIGAFPALACVGLTFAWMIVMTNGFNLIDVMDGLASGVALVSSPWPERVAGSCDTPSRPPRSTWATPARCSSAFSWEGSRSRGTTRRRTRTDGLPPLRSSRCPCSRSPSSPISGSAGAPPS
jgi:hypothetical protein